MSKPEDKKTPGEMPETTALHGAVEDGTYVVGIGHLKVVIIPDGDFWFAQGLEIDYTAQGNSLEDAKQEFENGLIATIHEHLRVHGSIKDLLRIAPQEAWNLAFESRATGHSYSQLTFHQIEEARSLMPFQAIKYLELQGA